MKALIVLKEFLRLVNEEGLDLSELCEQTDLIEKYVVPELEALQQRSCEECVHRSFIDEALTNKVTNGFCIENGFFTKVGFCCNRYEAKE